MQIAQINVGRVRYPLDDPRMAGFVDNLARVNAIAERSEGFVWRLVGEGDDATSIKLTDDPQFIINMSVWAGPEALEAFVYRTVHGRFVQRREDWFEPYPGPFLALWWVGEGERPTPQEGLRRLRLLEAQGPSSEAFTLARRFSMPAR